MLLSGLKGNTIYRTNGVPYYRPWVFLITDGQPTDEWRTAAQRVHQDEERKAIAFFSIGVQGADLATLGQISVRKPLALNGLQFSEMFMWLSSSLSSVSQSQVGEQVALQAPRGWTAV